MKKTSKQRTNNIIGRINIKPRLDYYRNSVYEYDINAAGYSILKKEGIFSDEEIKFLEKSNKDARNIYIGNLMKDNRDLIKIVETGLLKSLNEFLLINEVRNVEVLTVKRDSLFILKRVKDLQLKGGISFKLANKYSGYFGFLNNIELYYSFNLLGRIERVVVKGLTNVKIESHKDGILKLVEYLLTRIQKTTNHSQLLEEFNVIKNKYLSLEYPIEYYREFNRQSYYRLKDEMLGKNFIIKELSEDQKDKIDTLFNYKRVILPIMASVLS